MPIEAALEVESRRIANVFGGEVQRNLLNIFFLTEQVKKETGVDDPSVRPGEVKHLGVLGAGLMGGGIAQLAADRGTPARMKDVEPTALARGFAAAAAVWRDEVRRRRLTPREMTIRMARLSGTLDYAGFARCEVTVEAVVEKLEVKRAVLAEWEGEVPPDAIFASNTSTIPIAQIAAAAARPGNVAGMHFFNPVHKMPLVEVIRGEKSSDETVATIFALAKRLGKTPVVVADLPGFLVNRILAPYLSEAVRLVREGCRIEDVDKTLTDFGMPVGPARAPRRRRARRRREGGRGAAGGLPAEDQAGRRRSPRGRRPARPQERRRLLRLHGRKAGRPFAGGVRSAAREVLGRVALLARRHRVAPRAADGQRGGVLPRGRRRARRPAKLDLAMIMGTGFPPFRGGLLRWADSLGLPRVRSLLEELTEKFGPRFEPARSIRRMADARETFYADSRASIDTQAVS